MRITLQVQAVLAEMMRSPRDQHYGLELVRATEMKSGTLYPILRRLEEAGWIEGSWEEVDPAQVGRPPRRFYRLTGEGVQAARTSLAESARRVGWMTQPQTGEMA